LVRKVREHSFVMVVGRSGSGKSSLVFAGLVPALRGERDLFWNVLTLRPGPTPLRSLAAAFNPRQEGEGAAEYETKISKEADQLRAGALDLLAHMIRRQLDGAEGKPNRLLLYIDQWEELYAQAASGGVRERVDRPAADIDRFIDLLLTAAGTSPVTVVGTVRADFYDPLIGHGEIRALLPSCEVLLARMSRSELKSTIVGPARKVGLNFDPPSLAERIVDEAGEDEGMLPLLQYALKESWVLRKGSTITADSYERSGGVREAIRITAERTFETLPEDDQRAARQLYINAALVSPVTSMLRPADRKSLFVITKSWAGDARGSAVYAKCHHSPGKFLKFLADITSTSRRLFSRCSSVISLLVVLLIASKQSKVVPISKPVSGFRSALWALHAP
jgi:hypothetical protein